jgi:site-specific DNA-methyltransferase (adenine-specific)
MLIEKNKVYNIAGIAGLKEIPADSVDLLITDLPLCIGVPSDSQKEGLHDSKALKSLFFDPYFREMHRVLKGGAKFYINTDKRTYPFLYPIISDYFIITNYLLWEHELNQAQAIESIIYGYKSLLQKISEGTKHQIWERWPINFVDKKPTQKPLPQIEKMITNSTSEGQLVLDTFMGFGTTGIAAINTNRDYIGFELDKQYFDIASSQINEAYKIKSEAV